MPPPPESDPFVSAMLAIPRLLARRSSCDEPLQLHSIAYLATAVRYSRQRAEMGVPGWSSRHVGERMDTLMSRGTVCGVEALPPPR